MKKTDGFTLIEAVIALVVLLGTTMIIQMLVQSNQHMRKLTNSSTANWYLFVAELESPKHEFELKNVFNQQMCLIDRHNQKRYWLRENQTVYLRGAKGGYLPILTDYQPHTLQVQRLDKRRVEISAQTKDGQKHHATLCFYEKIRQRHAGGNSTNDHSDGHHGDQLSSSGNATPG